MASPLATLVGSITDPDFRLSIPFNAKHPGTGDLLRYWIKEKPPEVRKWEPKTKTWLVSGSALEPGELTGAGFEVVSLDGSPVVPVDPAEVATRPLDRFEVPDWFGLDLDGYQRDGAAGVAAGRFVLADAPGVGKTRQTLAVAAGSGADRILILCPPGVVTHWTREIEVSGLARQAPKRRGGKKGAGPPRRSMTSPKHSGGGPAQTTIHELQQESTDGNRCHCPADNGHVLVAINPKRKQPPLPDKGVVLVPDATVRSRPQLVSDLWDWRPDFMAYDEAHRAKTWESQTSQAARTLAARCAGPVMAVSGTPMFAHPEELAPLLDMTGHLRTVFGGRAEFVDAYTREARYGRIPRARMLPDLESKLREFVWVRRVKADVLKDMPPKSRRKMVVDVDLAAWHEAHQDVAEAVEVWLEDCPDPSADEIFEWCAANVGLLTRLRRAAGMTKVPAAVEHAKSWVEANLERVDGELVCGSPLVVWGHHGEVIDALADSVPEALMREGLGRAESIVGATSRAERDRIVDDFQAGKVPVLVCSTMAAGVGITLTRASDTLFVETDWTPAVVSQAEDRLHRRGQENHVTAMTMMAPGTLDEHIHGLLAGKADVLDAVMPGGDHHVSALGDGQRVVAAKLLASIVERIVAEHRGKTGSGSRGFRGERMLVDF